MSSSSQTHLLSERLRNKGKKPCYRELFFRKPRIACELLTRSLLTTKSWKNELCNNKQHRDDGDHDARSLQEAKDDIAVGIEDKLANHKDAKGQQDNGAPAHLVDQAPL